MVDFRCPSCGRLEKAASSAMGTQRACATCGRLIVLDVESIARFELPDAIAVAVLTTDGRPWITSPVLRVTRGRLVLPPLRAIEGELMLTPELFSKAERDDAETGLMDQRGDIRLVRYVEIEALTKDVARSFAAARRNSRWPILPFEGELYGSLDALIDGYLPADAPDVRSARVRIDLEAPPRRVELHVASANESR